jgi:RNA polymerase sigma-70 factor (ECF subfamily)
MPEHPDQDEDAGTLYAKHAQQVTRWAERLLGPDSDLDDVVHEVFFIAHQRLAGFRGDSSLTTWLFGITRRVVSSRRRKNRWRRWLLGSSTEAMRQLPSTWPDPERQLQGVEAARSVYRVLDQLPERDRQILILFEMEGLSAEEVGGMMGIKPANARLRLHRARVRFMHFYEAMETLSQPRRGADVAKR